MKDISVRGSDEYQGTRFTYTSSVILIFQYTVKPVLGGQPTSRDKMSGYDRMAMHKRVKSTESSL